MFSIGEFSKITGLTVKTLRFYHERGLLVPARVETGSGYRYYDARNIDTARTIVGLKDLGFSLDEISTILRDHADEADILKFLERQKSQLKAQMARDREIVFSIDQIIQKENEAREMNQQTSFEDDDRVGIVSALPVWHHVNLKSGQNAQRQSITNLVYQPHYGACGL